MKIKGRLRELLLQQRRICGRISRRKVKMVCLVSVLSLCASSLIATQRYRSSNVRRESQQMLACLSLLLRYKLFHPSRRDRRKRHRVMLRIREATSNFSRWLLLLVTDQVCTMQANMQRRRDACPQDLIKAIQSLAKTRS